MRCKGTQFDERITNTFFHLLRKELSGEAKEPQILPHLQNIDAGSIKGLLSDHSM
jgi:hypothetical protein